MALPRMSVHVSFPDQISETYGGDFFHVAHTHPLGVRCFFFLILNNLNNPQFCHN